jgi:dihydrofolate reductase
MRKLRVSTQVDSDNQSYTGAKKRTMRIVVSQFTSLDGVGEDPGGAEGYRYGGWTFRWHNQEVEADKKDELFAADALLLGRVTYQGFAAAWPSVADEVGFADRMNAIPKYVVTSTLDELDWNNSHRLTGDVAAAVAELKRQPGRDLLVEGSFTLVRELARHNLVDLYRFTIYPVMLGSGKRIFGDDRVDLDLVGQRPTSSGVLIACYQPAPAQGKAA